MIKKYVLDFLTMAFYVNSPQGEGHKTTKKASEKSELANL